MRAMSDLRIGFGEDAHGLVSGHPLVLGGFEIPESPLGASAHSDGDVLLHALCDALLSAFGLGDIGQYFPPSNPNYAGLDSQVILQTVQDHIRDAVGEVQIVNVAGVVTLDRPKLGPHRVQIQQTLAEVLSLEPGHVGVTFKTSEGLAPRHVQARVTVLLRVEASRGSAG